MQNKLTTIGIRALNAPGWYGDGGGLWLRVDPTGGKRWVFIFQWRRRRSEMGLGAFREVDLKTARAGREEARRLIREGKNPIEERRRDRATPLSEQRTFGEWAEEIAPAIGPKAEKAQKAWISMMKDKVGGLAQMSPAEITTEDVLKALKPYWSSRPETGQRMRQRIERILDSAKSKGLITDPWQNPARLRGHLENLLERRATAVVHRAAMPFADVAKFMAKLRKLDRLPARALELTILTAARNIEARGAQWHEIDFDEKVWTVPAGRMKGEGSKRREHRVPLSGAAVSLLKALRPKDAKKEAFVFPCPLSKSGIYSENALQDLLNDMGWKGKATVHGFRSTFRDWAGETTDFQRETIEAALAHVVGDQTERAYRRGDALAKRRELMDAWATYLSGRAPAPKSGPKLG